MKAIANTNIRLGLVNLPVQICQAAETASDVTFKLASPEGAAVAQVYRDDAGNIFERSELLRGVFDGGEFFPIADTDLKAIEEATKLPDLSVTEVIDASEFWSQSHRITGLYYVQNSQSKSAKGNPAAFKLFVDALNRNGQVMVTKWTARSRQKLMVLWPKDGLLMASSLAFEGDVREPDAAVVSHIDAAYTDAEMAMATQLLSAYAKEESTALPMEVDDAIAMKHKLVDDAVQGRGVTVPEAPQTTKNTALADALAASLAALNGDEKIAA